MPKASDEPSVAELDGDSAVVITPRLVRGATGIELGDPSPGSFRVALSGRTLAHGLAVGDWVSLHWDWVCDRLTFRQLAALRAMTAADLASVNIALAPESGVVNLP